VVVRQLQFEMKAKVCRVLVAFFCAVYRIDLRKSTLRMSDVPLVL